MDVEVKDGIAIIRIPLHTPLDPKEGKKSRSVAYGQVKRMVDLPDGRPHLVTFQVNVYERVTDD